MEPKQQNKYLIERRIVNAVALKRLVILAVIRKEIEKAKAAK